MGIRSFIRDRKTVTASRATENGIPTSSNTRSQLGMPWIGTKTGPSGNSVAGQTSDWHEGMKQKASHDWGLPGDQSYKNKWNLPGAATKDTGW